MWGLSQPSHATGALVTLPPPPWPGNLAVVTFCPSLPTWACLCSCSHPLSQHARAVLSDLPGPYPGHWPVVHRPAFEHHVHIADGDTRAGSHACRGSGEWGAWWEQPPDAIISSFSQHHGHRTGSSPPAISRHSCQPCGHRGGIELVVMPLQQGSSYSQDRWAHRAHTPALGS